MDTTSQSPPASPDAARGYESVTLSGTALRRVALSFSLAVVASLVAVWFLLMFMDGQTRPVDQPQSILQQQSVIVTQAPPLQPSTGHDTVPRQDLQQMIAEENAVFERIGWKLNPQTGVPTIPPNIQHGQTTPKTGGTP